VHLGFYGKKHIGLFLLDPLVFSQTPPPYFERVDDFYSPFEIAVKSDRRNSESPVSNDD
jgi:hypothetical protein